MTTTPSRRSVLRAAAWSAPAVAVVAAAPAHAASVTNGAFEITASRPYSGGAFIGVRNLSSVDSTVVTLTILEETATAKTGSWGYTPGLVVGQDDGLGAITFSTTLAPAQWTGNVIQMHWTNVSGDGALQVVGNATGLAPVVLGLPWRATPPV
jgi:hypothetical protein